MFSAANQLRNSGEVTTTTNILAGHTGYIDLSHSPRAARIDVAIHDSCETIVCPPSSRPICPSWQRQNRAGVTANFAAYPYANTLQPYLIRRDGAHRRGRRWHTARAVYPENTDSLLQKKKEHKR